MENKRTCSKCGTEHEWEQKGHGSICRECWNAYHRDWSHRNRPKLAERGRKYYHKLRTEKLTKLRTYQRRANLRRYGIAPEWYDKKLKEQGGVCAICKSTETGRNQYGPLQRLSVDHNHETGAVRGLLCGACNRSLHRVEANDGWIDKASAYLRKYE